MFNWDEIFVLKLSVRVRHTMCFYFDPDLSLTKFYSNPSPSCFKCIICLKKTVRCSKCMFHKMLFSLLLMSVFVSFLYILLHNMSMKRNIFTSCFWLNEVKINVHLTAVLLLINLWLILCCY